jgi:ABC-type branched-subunit amino acid transport system ATPase component/ABC-type branched-subunit amino acid transport system permease subunit
VWGIALSSLSALFALGLALVYRSHRVINFAQADLGAVPATLAVSLVAISGWSYWFAVPLALLVALALGSLVEIVVIRRFRRAPRLILMVATIGLAQLLAALAQAIQPLFGATTPVLSLPPAFSFRFEIAPFVFHAGEVMAVVSTVVVISGLFAFLRFTHLGIALRAAADRSDRASLLGVNVGITQNVAWALASLIGAIAMILRAGMIGLPIGTLFGPSLLLRALAAAVIGRMENLAVIFAAACAIGMLETAVLWNEGSSELIDPVLFVVILVALLLQRQRAEPPRERQLASTWDDAALVTPVPRELARLPEVRTVFAFARVLVIALVLALPFMLGLRDTNLAAAVLIYAIIAISLVILTGWAGEISLGQVAFVAIGSAAAGSASVHWGLGPVLCILLASGIGAGASVIIGVPALRLRGLFLSVTTLAFAVATSSYLLDRERFPFLPDNLRERVERGSIPTPFGSIDVGSERAFYYVCAAGLLLVVLAVRGLERSRVRRDIVAARDNPSNAMAFGLSPARAKLLAFALSGFFASFAGGLLVLHQQALGEQIFAPIESLRALTMVVVGGLNSVPGAVLGAVFVKSTEWFNVFVPQQFRRVFTFAGSGTGLLLVLWLLPGGFGSLLVGARNAFLRAVARRRGLSVPSLVTDRSAPATSTRAPTPSPGLLAASTTGGTTPLPSRSRTEPAGLLSFRDVDLTYGHVQVVFDANLEVQRGESLALLGTNGAGKSTMLSAASGLLAPSRGRIVFDGTDISGMAPHRIAARGLAYVPGGRSVFLSLTVAENLRMGGWLRRRDRAELRAATERALELFPGLRARLHDPAHELSGGQQQMLAIAMALLTTPKVLLVDELSLGLSPLVIDQVLDVLARLHADGLTVVVVEQSVDTAARSTDRAVFLDDGVIRFRGATGALFDRPDLLRSVFIDRDVHVPSAFAPDTAAVPSTSPSPGPEIGPIVLTATGVSHRFAGVAALDDVTIELHDGEILGIVGPNGAGKTTLLDVISGFLAADAGRVTSIGVDITAWRPERRARHGLARSFQDARLFPSLTVHQSIEVALDRELAVLDPITSALRLPGVTRHERAIAARADEIIETMGLALFRDKFVSELSTGSRRIVELACQLATAPEVLLLDEPSAGIAQRETEALGALLLRVRAATGASLMMIEHNLPLVSAVCDRVIALDLGRVIAVGTPAETLADPAVIDAYIGSGRDPNQFGRHAGRVH